jgi:hypothetical protein
MDTKDIIQKNICYFDDRLYTTGIIRSFQDTIIVSKDVFMIFFFFEK